MTMKINNNNRIKIQKDQSLQKSQVEEYLSNNNNRKINIKISNNNKINKSKDLLLKSQTI